MLTISAIAGGGWAEGAEGTGRSQQVSDVNKVPFRESTFKNPNWPLVCKDNWHPTVNESKKKLVGAIRLLFC